MDKMTLEISSAPARYTIEHRLNCILITGAVPAGAFQAIAKIAPGHAVLDPDTARILDVTFVIGLPEDLTKLREAGAANALAREQYSNPGLPLDAVKWLAHGERGSSSNAIFSHLTGINASREAGNCDHPYDPSDLRRCRLLLEQVPSLAPLLPSMSTASVVWSRMVENWDEICRVMDDETPNWRNPASGAAAPQTYNLIKQARGGR